SVTHSQEMIEVVFCIRILACCQRSLAVLEHLFRIRWLAKRHARCQNRRHKNTEQPIDNPPSHSEIHPSTALQTSRPHARFATKESRISIDSCTKDRYSHRE